MSSRHRNAELFGTFESLTFDDVLVVPGWSELLPSEVDIATSIGGVGLQVPLISAAMDTVTEAPLAIALAREGGMGVLHRNLSVEAQAAECERGVVINHQHLLRRPFVESGHLANATTTEIHESLRLQQQSSVG